MASDIAREGGHQNEVWDVQPGEPKPATVYFRKEFQVDVPDSGELLVARIRADDGAALYLNGQEVARVRLPDGPLHGGTFATASVYGDAEAWFRRIVIDRALLKEGSNLLAIEVHQESANSSDVIFDLELFWDRRVSNLSADLAGFDPEPVIERIRQEGSGGLPPLPPFASTLASAQALALTGKWEEALRMTEPALTQVSQGSEGARVVARFRSHCLDALGRQEEAQKELALGVPERSKEALPKHLDLSHHYTAYLDEPLFGGGSDNFLRLPAAALQGVIEADELSFEVRGVVHMYCPPDESGESSLLDFPKEVRGIEVNTSASELHFLHAASGSGILGAHLRLGSYLITYADGKVVEIPVHTQDRDINSIGIPNKTAQRFYPDGGFFPTWKGPSVNDPFGSTVLYVKSWTNPRPEVPLRAIDVISSGDPEAPALMLFGITTEPAPGRNEKAK